MKKPIAALAATLLALGAVALSAAPASAHTGGVTGQAVCEEDGTYTVTWTYTAANVPDGVEAETKAMTTTPGSLAPIDGVDKGGQVFLSVWSEHQVNVPGAPVRTGNWSAQFKTVGVPGTHVGDVTTMVQTDWKNGPSEDPVGKVTVDGKCDTPPPMVPEPKVETTHTDWVDGKWACGDTTVEQTRTTTVTTTTYKVEGKEIVVDTVTPVTTTETRTRDLTAEEQASDDEVCAGVEPPVKVVKGEWVRGAYECGDTTVEETRAVWTTTFTRSGEEWVANGPVETTETRTRDLTDAEIEALDCAVTPPVTPPVTEEKPTPTPTPTPVAFTPPTDRTPPTDTEVLASAGGTSIVPLWLGAGGLVALGVALVAWPLARRKGARAEA